MGYMCENLRSQHRTGLDGIDIRPGTRTTHKSKEAIVAKLTDLLLNNALNMHRKFHVPHPDQQPQGEVTTEDNRTAFIDELANMHMIFCEPKGPQARQFQRGHIKFKGYKNGQKANDDKFMALGFSLQCYPLYISAPQLFMRVVQPNQGGLWSL